MKIIKMLKSLIEFLKNEIARDVSDMIDIDGDYDIFGDEEKRKYLLEENN